MITVKHFRLKTLNASADVWCVRHSGEEKWGVKKKKQAAVASHVIRAIWFVVVVVESSQVRIESKIKIFFWRSLTYALLPALALSLSLCFKPRQKRWGKDNSCLLLLLMHACVWERESNRSVARTWLVRGGDGFTSSVATCEWETSCGRTATANGSSKHGSMMRSTHMPRQQQHNTTTSWHHLHLLMQRFSSSPFFPLAFSLSWK